MIALYAWVQSSVSSLAAKRDERGATAVEYGLLVALIAAVIIVTVVTLGEQINSAFTKITTELTGKV